MSEQPSILDDLLNKNGTSLSPEVPMSVAATSAVPHEVVLVGGLVLFLVISVISVYFVVRVCFRRSDDEEEQPEEELHQAVEVTTTADAGASETTGLVPSSTSASRTRFLEKRRQAVQQGKKNYGSVDT